jgi:hypothetical protein
MDKEPIKSMSEWEIYRHKNRPDIRYYVQADIAGGVVRLKTPKNIAFDKDKEDFPVSKSVAQERRAYGLPVSSSSYTRRRKLGATNR